MDSTKIAGLYRHYKGQMYRVMGTVRHSETLESLVLYECLYENKLGRTWVRPESMFFGKVTVDGREVDRFARVEGLVI